MSRPFGTIIQIGDILVSEDVVLEYFACAPEVCLGACCIVGDSGAPLEEAETVQIEQEYGHFSARMEEAGRETVSEKGFFEVDRDGDLVTPLTPDSEACAYAYFTPEGNCFCAMESCFEAGQSAFRKPVSCWLYPVRVTRLRSGGLALNVHHWHICRAAFERGRRERIRVYEFLRAPLLHTFGEEFYSALSEAARRLIAAS